MFHSILCCLSIGATGKVVRLSSLAGLIHKHAYGWLHASLKAKKNQEEATNYTGLSNSSKFSLYINLKPQGRKIIITKKKTKNFL